MPAKDGKAETVATTAGPIRVEKPVDDQAIRQTLQELLPTYPGVRRAQVNVKNGVVTIDGRVDDDDTRDDVTDFSRRVEGVRLVLNRMNTDAEVLSARELAANLIRQIGQTIARKWLLVLIAIGIALLFSALARLFNAYSETLMAPFVRNILVRSVIGSVISSLLIVGGLGAALSILNLTHIVLSILGLAGVVGLAVGFAFKDIAENFIASLLLGVRRPFRIGDYIQVAGQAGVVQTLNTRATVLVTLEGNHVRIPNNVIYKEIMINSSATPSARGTFDVIVPYEASTDAALEAVTEAMRGQEGVLADPAPRTLVQALEPGGVRLRAFFWMSTQGVDGDKVQSDVKLRAKVGLQQAGITPPPAAVALTVAGRVPVQVCESNGHPPAETAVRPGAVVTAEEAAANLRRDSHAADRAADSSGDGHREAVARVLSEAGANVSSEGENLLAGAPMARSG